MTDLPTITVDFSNAGDDGLVFARLADASQPVSEGDRVVATDEEHECYGRVARTDEALVYLELDWDSWCTIEEPVTAPTWIEVRTVSAKVASNGGAQVESDSAPIPVFS